MPNCEIRLEMPYRKEKNWHLDIWLPTQGIAIELKYITQQLKWKGISEDFSLSKHSGHPQKRYDFLKDIQRLEQVAKDLECKIGFAILLTNAHGLWDPPKGNGWKTTTDAAFRFHEDRKLTGALIWSAQASDGTKKGREEPIRLNGSYHMNWWDYSSLGTRRNQQFRYLAVLVK